MLRSLAIVVMANGSLMVARILSYLAKKFPSWKESMATDKGVRIFPKLLNLDPLIYLSKQLLHTNIFGKLLIILFVDMYAVACETSKFKQSSSSNFP